MFDAEFRKGWSDEKTGQMPTASTHDDARVLCNHEMKKKNVDWKEDRKGLANNTKADNVYTRKEKDLKQKKKEKLSSPLDRSNQSPW